MRHRPALGGRQAGLGADGAGGQVEQGAADQRGGVLADLEQAQVDDHDAAVGDQLPEVDRGDRLADDLAGGPRGQVLVHLGLDRVDDLQAQARIERLEVGLEPVRDHGVAGLFQDLVCGSRGGTSSAGTSSTVCWAARPRWGSSRQSAWLASNRAMSAKRKASSMRGPQKASNSRRKMRRALPTAWSRSQPRPTSSRLRPNGRRWLAMSR